MFAYWIHLFSSFVFICFLFCLLFYAQWVLIQLPSSVVANGNAAASVCNASAYLCSFLWHITMKIHNNNKRNKWMLHNRNCINKIKKPFYGIEICACYIPTWKYFSNAVRHIFPPVSVKVREYWSALRAAYWSKVNCFRAYNGVLFQISMAAWSFPNMHWAIPEHKKKEVTISYNEKKNSARMKEIILSRENVAQQRKPAILFPGNNYTE